jgi:LacI family transcriptional regulator
MIVPDGRIPLFAQMIHEVEQQAMARDHVVLVGNTHVDSDRERGYIQDLVGLRARGIILLSHRGTKEIVEDISQHDTRVVLFFRGLTTPRATSVVGNYRELAEQATHHLCDHGYDSVGMVGLQPGFRPNADPISLMINGWRAAARSRGLSAANAPSIQAPFDTEGALPVLERTLRGRRPVRSLLLATAGQTEAAYLAARRLGLRVPEDLALISMQLPASSLLFEPPPSYTSLNLTEMARAAVDELIDHDDTAHSTQVIPGSFAPGPSCGPHPIVAVRRRTTQPRTNARSHEEERWAIDPT